MDVKKTINILAQNYPHQLCIVRLNKQLQIKFKLIFSQVFNTFYFMPTDPFLISSSQSFIISLYVMGTEQVLTLKLQSKYCIYYTCDLSNSADSVSLESTKDNTQKQQKLCDPPMLCYSLDGRPNLDVPLKKAEKIPFCVMGHLRILSDRSTHSSFHM